jgi:hypothetical protein
VNCYTFDVLRRLSDTDADLFFCTGHCFVCRTTIHHTKRCTIHGPSMLLCKHLDDPHHVQHY